MSIIPILLLAWAVAPAGVGDCSPVPGWEQVIQDGVVLALGEIHGTAESPTEVGDLTCLALKRGLETTVALEWPRSDQAAVDRYLSGEGSSEERASLLELDFWSRDYQDGRSSQAMFNLLERLRGFKADGLPVKVVLLDDPTVPSNRDRAMADRLLAAAAGKKGLVVSLTGNLHNRLTQGSPWNADYVPMGHLVKKELKGRKLISLDLTHDGGSAWICTGSSAADCGSRRLKGSPGDVGIKLDSVPNSAFSGTCHLGAITASPPAARPTQPHGQ